MEWIAVWIFCGVISAAIANSRGRSGCGWLLLGFIFGPFGFAVALLPRIENTRGLAKCPFCMEFIKPEAIKCRHCGSDIPVGAQTISSAPKRKMRKIPGWVATIALIMLLMIFAVMAFRKYYMIGM